MKLESLNLDKFKSNEVNNPKSIFGGTLQPVATSVGGRPDERDYATNDGHSTDGAGTPWDWRWC